VAPGKARPKAAAKSAKKTSAAAKKRPTLAFVTTCKGRLHHLKQTLPLMAAQRPDELIVVDYSCPQRTGDWVEANFPQAKVVRVSGEDRFNPSRARNAGAAAATSEWLFFVDADIRVGEALTQTLREAVTPGNFYRPTYPLGRNAGQAYGSFCVSAEDFAAVEGFDEVIGGWGYEDQDIYERLELRVARGRYSFDMIEVIVHDDSERNVLPGMQDRWHNEAVNGCYGEAKRAISRYRGGGGNLPLDERQKLMEHAKEVVGNWFARGAPEPLTMRIKIDVTKPHRFASQLWGFSEHWVCVVLDPRQMHGAPTTPAQAPENG
jgi:glycosyltransferase involved in cell wall biosynthesis